MSGTSVFGSKAYFIIDFDLFVSLDTITSYDKKLMIKYKKCISI